MVVSPGQQVIVAAVLDGEAGISHGFFTRKGGVSRGLYASLNCGPGSNDDAGAVAANREKAMAKLAGANAKLVTVHQIHSASVVVVDDASADLWKDGGAPKADGMVTVIPGLAIGVLTADCAPVLFADPGAGVIGAAHAGWKGALSGVIEATVEAMISLGARRSGITACVGPCIAQTSYQVGPEFYQRFRDTDGGSGLYFIASEKDEHFLFDLKGYVVARLAGLGLKAVEALDHDTCAEDELFFSYRRATHRGEEDYGRQLSAIALIGMPPATTPPATTPPVGTPPAPTPPVGTPPVPTPPAKT